MTPRQGSLSGVIICPGTERTAVNGELLPLYCYDTVPQTKVNRDALPSRARCVLSYPDGLSSTELGQRKADFLQFAADYFEERDRDPDWLRQMAADLEYVGERIDVDVARFTGPLNASADELDADREVREPDSDDGDEWRSPATDDNDIHTMFESLRENPEALSEKWCAPTSRRHFFMSKHRLNAATPRGGFDMDSKKTIQKQEEVIARLRRMKCSTCGNYLVAFERLGKKCAACLGKEIEKDRQKARRFTA